MAESQTLGQYQAQQAALTRLQATVTDPPGSGLGDMLDQFFQGFEAVAANPTDQAVRVTLQGHRRAAGTHVPGAAVARSTSSRRTSPPRSSSRWVRPTG